MGERRRSATRTICASRCELPLLGSNQDSPDPESGVLPVTPRGTVPKDYTVGSSGRATVKNQNRGEWGVGLGGAVPNARFAPSGTTPHSPRPLCRSDRGPGRETAYGAEGARTPAPLGAVQALSPPASHPLGHRRGPDRSGLRPAHRPAPRPRLAPGLPVRPRQRLPRPQRRTLAPARTHPPPPRRPPDRDPRVHPAHRVRLARDRAALGLQNLLQARVPGWHDRRDDETRVDAAELQRVAERGVVPAP